MFSSDSQENLFAQAQQLGQYFSHVLFFIVATLRVLVFKTYKVLIQNTFHGLFVFLLDPKSTFSLKHDNLVNI
jgi:hypothetical protein